MVWIWHSFKNKLEGRRSDLVKCFEKYNIEARPLLAGNFLKNPVIEHLDYIVPYACKNSDYIDENGIMLGNYNRDMTNELQLLEDCLREFFQTL
jgi:CDP-6-deoxy-D-xylo-4-hexulose-3-dehydrase